MRHVASLFILLGLLFMFHSPSQAQQRGIGGRTLVLDDGFGHIVNITIPNMLGPGPYSWLLPITPSGVSVFPAGTTNNSILRWNAATASWQEDVSILANGGALSATSFSGAGTGLTGTAAGLSIGGNAATSTNFTGSLSGDVTGTQSATAINGSSAAGGHIITALTANAGSLTNNTSGNAATSTNFTGSLSGDVTGTQSATAINGSSAAGGHVITALTANAGSLTNSTSGTASNVTGTVTETHGGTNQTTYATGDILYASSSNTLTKLTAGANGDVLTLAGGVPTWAAPSGGGGGSALALYDNNAVKLGTVLYFDYGSGVNIITSSGYNVSVLMQPDGSGNDFPINQIYWTGASCTGSPYLNDGGTTGSQQYYKVLCYSGSAQQLYELASPNANHVSTSVAFTSAGVLENPTCMSGYPIAESGWALTADSRATVGLPATIAYPLNIH